MSNLFFTAFNLVDDLFMLPCLPFVNKSLVSNLFSAVFNLVDDLFVLPRLLYVIESN